VRRTGRRHAEDKFVRWSTATSIFAALVPAAALVVTQSSFAQSEHVHQHPTVEAYPADDTAVRSTLASIEVDFDLVDRDDHSVQDEDFRGGYLLVAFGFTQCTDVCPLIAFNMASVLKSTTKKAAGVFISVDTERDTPAIVNRYARGFDERIVGLGGSPEQINAAVRNFNAKYVVTKSQDGITVQHTSHIYLISPEGNLIDVFAYTTPASELAAAMN
jgi:protein SCO1/2